MSDDPNKPGEPQKPPDLPERRLMVRYPSTAGATVLRDSDAMRVGTEAKLHDVSIGGIGLTLKTDIPGIGEQIKVRLVNQIQRIEKEVRGVVRHVTPRDDGTFQIGLELYVRLTPLEVSLLKMSLPSGQV